MIVLARVTYLKMFRYYLVDSDHIGAKNKYSFQIITSLSVQYLILHRNLHVSFCTLFFNMVSWKILEVISTNLQF